MLKVNWRPPSLSIGTTRIHYGWLIATMAAILQVTTNFVNQAFAVLLPIIEDTFGWSLTAITLSYFFKSIVQALLSPVAGWVADRYGARRSLLTAATLYVGGMLALSSINQVWQLYLCYSLILGIAQSLFSVNIPTTVAAWFKKRLGVATGLQQSLGGMGASIMAPALALILGRTDWQTAFVIIAITGGAVLFGLLMLFRNDPAERGMRPYGTTEDDPPPVATTNPAMTKLRTQVFMQHVRRTMAFWNLITIHHMGCVGHSIVMVSAVNFATTKGVPLEAAALIVSIYSFGSIATRFITPVLADRFGAKGVMALFFFVQGVTVALLFWTHEAWHFYLFAALFGIGLGGEMSAFIIINRQYYGMGPVRTVFGWQHLGSGLGMALGGLLGSAIFDIFGAYDIAWLISIAASLGGVVCILLLEPTSRILIPHWEESLPPEARSTSPAKPAPSLGD
jgi:MFS family permease